MRLSVFAFVSLSLEVKGEEPAPALAPVDVPNWDTTLTQAPSQAFFGGIEPVLGEHDVTTEPPLAALVFGGPVETPTGGGEAPSPTFLGGGEPDVPTEAPSAVLAFGGPVLTPTWGGEPTSNPNNAPPTDEFIPPSTNDNVPTDEPPTNESVPMGTEGPTHNDIPVDESPMDMEVPTGAEDLTNDNIPVNEEFFSDTTAPTGEPTREPTRDDGTLRPVASRYTDSPTETPQAYIATDDDPLQPLDPLENINDGGSSWEWKDSKLEDMEHDRTVMVALLSVFGVGIFLSICVAHQMTQNPRGCCASVCHVLVACTCFFIRCIFYPCAWFCGCNRSGRGTHKMTMSEDMDDMDDMEFN